MDKILSISNVIGIHSISLLVLAHLYGDENENLDTLLLRIKNEVENIERQRQ